MPFNMLPVTSKDDRYASEKHGGDSVALTVAKPTGDSSFGVVMQSYSNESGVLVAELREGGLLQEAGVRVGDRILKIRGEEATGANMAAGLLKAAAAGEVELVLRRAGDAGIEVSSASITTPQMGEFNAV